MDLKLHPSKTRGGGAGGGGFNRDGPSKYGTWGMERIQEEVG